MVWTLLCPVPVISVFPLKPDGSLPAEEALSKLKLILIVSDSAIIC
ncbi:hypothetical protein ACZ87_00003 [Candidatus Erwinia dacicola]|uniref:Uncharacterized protein n=1 Tax=Candidatus Erwinia dacicola TaxID=252393 RepID=A0A328TU22_9GAMM|nr:hypothetical protein ACZ87_00003 [Candidatus Erwinia dacicola]